jgi:chromosome segregation ATPase
MTSAQRTRPRAALLLTCALLAGLSGPAGAQQDRNAERNARRLQLQLQNLQQQLDEAQAARAKLDADNAAAQKALAAQKSEIPRAQGALRKKSEELQASEAARAELASRVDALEKQLAEQKRSSDDALAAKDRTLAQALALHQKQEGELGARFEAQAGQLGECSDKNRRLVTLGAELLDRYRKKGFGEVLRQREPVLGLGDVEMFNLVQDYRDKLDAQRFSVGQAKPPQAP